MRNIFSPPLSAYRAVQVRNIQSFFPGPERLPDASLAINAYELPSGQCLPREGDPGGPKRFRDLLLNELDCFTGVSRQIHQMVMGLLPDEEREALEDDGMLGFERRLQVGALAVRVFRDAFDGAESGPWVHVDHHGVGVSLAAGMRPGERPFAAMRLYRPKPAPHILALGATDLPGCVVPRMDLVGGAQRSPRPIEQLGTQLVVFGGANVLLGRIAAQLSGT